MLHLKRFTLILISEFSDGSHEPTCHVDMVFSGQWQLFKRTKTTRFDGRQTTHGHVHRSPLPFGPNADSIRSKPSKPSSLRSTLTLTQHSLLESDVSRDVSTICDQELRTDLTTLLNTISCLRFITDNRRRAVVFNLFCSRTPDVISQLCTAVSSWCIIQVIQSIIYIQNNVIYTSNII
jgi:hypothetical protein